jgi:hypothetical protein
MEFQANDRSVTSGEAEWVVVISGGVVERILAPIAKLSTV